MTSFSSCTLLRICANLMSPAVPWVGESEYFSPLTCHGRWSIEHENNFLSPQQRIQGMLGVHSRSPKKYSCIFRISSVFRHHLAVMLDSNRCCIVLPNRALLILTSGSQSVKSDLLCDHPNLIYYGSEPFQSRGRESFKLCLFSIYTLC